MRSSPPAKSKVSRTTRRIDSSSHTSQAQAAARSAFSGEGDADGVPEHHVPRAALEAGILLVQLFADAGLAPSRGEAKRLIRQGGAYVNREKVTDMDFSVTAEMIEGEKGILLRAGKKRYVRVKPLPGS